MRVEKNKRLVKLKLYILTFMIFLAVDSLWLGLAAPQFYRSQIGHLMADLPNFFAAGIFYLIFVFGMVFFVIEPGKNSESMPKTVVRGAIFGFVTYATYDLTNHATLSGWPILMTIVDMAWGTTLSAAVTLVSVWAGKRLIK